MKYATLIISFWATAVLFMLPARGGGNVDNVQKLTGEEARIMVQRGTERPFSGRFHDFKGTGTYVCKRCGSPLFRSESKFDSGCGWPSFDEEIAGAVARRRDPDGLRTEIACAACDAHLGHVFLGEGFTARNTRHCVNSLAMSFIPADGQGTEAAVFASGCFWGTQHHLQAARGVLATTVGYTGGHLRQPTYKQVCGGGTGHAEAVRVVYDPSQVSYEQLARLYFETHDFTQVDRQGPDIGSQYRSEIFYLDEGQRQAAEKLLAELRAKGYQPATRLSRAGEFWPAEDYHQNYYWKTNGSPYCHVYRKIF